MVASLEEYKQLLARGITAYDTIIELYTPDRHAENDWADVTLAEAITKRNGLAERLTNLPAEVTAENTSPVMMSIDRFVDSHWADYKESPVANSEKRARIEQLHAELEAVAHGIGRLYNIILRVK